MRIADFETLLKDDFQIIENLLSDGIFAAYLLGFDATRAENQAKINAANFAEGDDEKTDKLVEQIGSDDLYLQLRLDVPPKEAIDYFKRKRVVTKKEFNKLSREAKAAAFTIQGRKEVIAGIHISWNELHPKLDRKESRKKRLLWIKNLLKINQLDSITELPNKQLQTVYLALLLLKDCYFSSTGNTSSFELFVRKVMQNSYSCGLRHSEIFCI